MKRSESRPIRFRPGSRTRFLLMSRPPRPSLEHSRPPKLLSPCSLGPLSSLHCSLHIISCFRRTIELASRQLPIADHRHGAIAQALRRARI